MIYSAQGEKTESARIFFNLLHNQPGTSDFNDKMQLMLDLCRINAHHTVKLVYKLHPDDIDLSILLREAISCLHTDTIEVLLELGADLHKPIVHSNFSDHGFQLFASPLYYALLLPQEPYSFLGRMFGQCLPWDNPRLTKMLEFLLSKGARPEQNCIAADRKVHNLETATDRAELAENCIVVANTILRSHREEGLALNQPYTDLLQRLANWAPDMNNDRHVQLQC